MGSVRAVEMLSEHKSERNRNTTEMQSGKIQQSPLKAINGSCIKIRVRNLNSFLPL